MTWEMCGGLQVQSSLKPLQLVSLVSGHASCANHPLSRDEQVEETWETAWESLRRDSAYQCWTRTLLRSPSDVLSWRAASGSSGSLASEAVLVARQGSHALHQAQKMPTAELCVMHRTSSLPDQMMIYHQAGLHLHRQQT